jgi:uncharacterized protein
MVNTGLIENAFCRPAVPRTDFSAFVHLTKPLICRATLDMHLMEERSPNIVTSGLSGKVTRDGISVELCIYRLETDKEWSLEVVNSAGTSIVWDELFASDDAANEEFLRTVAEEGMASFLDNANVIPLRR